MNNKKKMAYFSSMMAIIFMVFLNSVLPAMANSNLAVWKSDDLEIVSDSYYSEAENMETVFLSVKMVEDSEVWDVQLFQGEDEISFSDNVYKNIHLVNDTYVYKIIYQKMVDEQIVRVEDTFTITTTSIKESTNKIEEVATTETNNDENGLGQVENEEEISAFTFKTSTPSDVSNRMEVLDWNILKRDGSTLSRENEALAYEGYKFAFSSSIYMPVGEFLKGGDYIHLDLPQNSKSGVWFTSSFDWIELSVGGVVIGNWKIGTTGIDIVFNDEVTGHTSYTFFFETGAQTLKNGTVEMQVQDVTFGAITKEIGFLGVAVKPATASDTKDSIKSTTDSLMWATRVNWHGAIELSTKDENGNLGQQFTVKENSYFEDTIDGEYLNDMLINTFIPMPISLESGYASSKTTQFNITKLFTKAEQTEGETYEAFKSRLDVYSYGAYVDSSGVTTVVVNLGNVGANQKRLVDAHKNYATRAANEAIKAGLYTEEDKDDLITYYTDTYGETNVIGGDIPTFNIVFSIKYEQTLGDTVRRNIASVKLGNTTTNVSGSGKLDVISSGGTLEKNSFHVRLIDKDTKVMLEGVQMKLQSYDDVTETWNDYEEQGPGTGTTIKTTNASGLVSFFSLHKGQYRFVEVKAKNDNYDLTLSELYDESLGCIISSTAEFLDNDAPGVTTIIENQRLKHDVTYTKGEYGDFEDVEFLQQYKGTITPKFNGTQDEFGNPKGKLGYDFVGWSPTVTSTIIDDVVYTATWKVKNYPIRYELYGGTNSSLNPTTYEYGVGVEMLQPATKVGYTFLGWYTSAFGGEEVTSISQTDHEAIVLYARYEVNIYSISYELDGGVNDISNPSSYTYGIGIEVFTNPTKEHHSFLGWFDAPVGGGQIVDIDKTSLGDRTLYARWKADSYSVAYDGNGHDGGIVPIAKSYEYNTNVLLTTEVPTKVGYTFLGWSYDEKTYQANDVITMPANDITFVAVWEINSYTISYDGNGHDSGWLPLDEDHIYNSVVDVKLLYLRKKGHKFIGWEYNGRIYQEGESLNVPANNVTFVAIWEIEYYPVTYIGNGHDGGVIPMVDKHLYDSLVTVSSHVPTKNGYTFIGWKYEYIPDFITEASFKSPQSHVTTGDILIAGQSFRMPAYGVRLIAQWELASYQINYHLNGGENISNNPNTYTYGEGVDSFSDAKRDGYTFLGWFDVDGNHVTSISVTAYGDIDLFAKWKEVDKPVVDSLPETPIIEESNNKSSNIVDTAATTNVYGYIQLLLLSFFTTMVVFFKYKKREEK